MSNSRKSAAKSRDIHIEPDWLLTYMPGEDVVRFERTGTHGDLFGK
jgi:mRNA interferase YafQ